MLGRNMNRISWWINRDSVTQTISRSRVRMLGQMGRLERRRVACNDFLNMLVVARSRTRIGEMLCAARGDSIS